MLVLAVALGAMSHWKLPTLTDASRCGPVVISDSHASPRCASSHSVVATHSGISACTTIPPRPATESSPLPEGSAWAYEAPLSHSR